MDAEERNYYDRVYEEQHRRYIQPLVEKIQLHKDCRCSVCTRVVAEDVIQPKEDCLLSQAGDEGRDKDFLFVIKRLQPSGERSLRFSIPDVCAFNGAGEMEYVITQLKTTPNVYSFTRHKRMPLQKLRRIFLERRVQKGESQSDFASKAAKTSKLMFRKDKNENFLKQLEKAMQEIAICKFTDGNSQVLTESEFSQLMCRRRSDGAFNEILYLQTFVRSSNYFRIKYLESTDDSTAQFSRAALEIRVLIKDIVPASSEYISQEMEAQYEAQMEDRQLAQYLTYKIVHFVEKVHSQKIKQGIFEWVIDANREFHLVGAIKVLAREIQAETKLEKKKSPQKEISEKFQPNDQVVQIYTQIMNNEYQKRKKELGMDERSFAVQKDKETELVFNELHKGTKLLYHEVFKDQESYQRHEASLVDYMKSQHSRVRSVKLNRVITQTSQPTQNTASPLKILNPRPSTCFNRQRSRVKVSQSLHQSYKQTIKTNTLPYLLAF